VAEAALIVKRQKLNEETKDQHFKWKKKTCKYLIFSFRVRKKTEYFPSIMLQRYKIHKSLQRSSL